MMSILITIRKLKRKTSLMMIREQQEMVLTKAKMDLKQMVTKIKTQKT